VEVQVAVQVEAVDRAQGGGGVADLGQGHRVIELDYRGAREFGQRRYSSARPVQPRFRGLPSQHRHLLAQHQQLGVLRG